MNRAGKRPRRVYGKVGVIAVNFHAEGVRRICNQNADCTKTDYTELFAFDFRTGKSGFAFFHHFGNFCAVTFKGLDPVKRRDNLS